MVYSLVRISLNSFDEFSRMKTHMFGFLKCINPSTVDISDYPKPFFFPPLAPFCLRLYCFFLFPNPFALISGDFI